MSLQVITVVTTMATLCYVTASECAVNTASVNCSFEQAEPCSEVYTFKDKHGLRWRSNAGDIRSGRRRLMYGSFYNKYMYMRGTDDSRAWGLWTDLTSPPFRVNGGCLQFSSFNSVCGDSTEPRQAKLKVIVRSADDDTLNSVIHTFGCRESKFWKSDRVPLSGLEGKFQIVFSTQHHGWTDQIIAVDHVLYTHQSCSLRDDVNFEAGDCDWEHDDPCGYHQSELAPTGGLMWGILHESQLKEGLRSPRNGRQGGLMLVSVSASNATSGDVIVGNLYSPKIRIHQSGCLTLRYYSGRYETDNNDVTALIIQATNSGNGSAPTILRELPTTLGDEWMPQYVPLRAGEYTLMFTARLLLPYGSQPYDFVAIDDVEITQKPCDDIKCDPLPCDTPKRCGLRGLCVGQGIKHYSCDCEQPRVGKSCQLTVPYSENLGFAVTEHH